MNAITLAALIVFFIGLSLIDPSSRHGLKRKGAAPGSGNGSARRAGRKDRDCAD